MTRYIDPHLDPLRAPSRAGHHPHIVPESASRINPQHMYEHRGQMPRPMPRMPVGQVPQQQQQPQSNFWTLVGVFGLGALAVYLGYRTAQGEAPRRNPEEAPQPFSGPAPTQVVVVPGAAQAAPVATQTVQPVLSLAEGAKQSADKPKRKRTRRTSQGRGNDGKYLPAGTRKRKITEGPTKKEK